MPRTARAEVAAPPTVTHSLLDRRPRRLVAFLRHPNHTATTGQIEPMHTTAHHCAHATVRVRPLCLRANRGKAMGLCRAATKCPGGS